MSDIIATDDVIREHFYLVSREVRALSLLGTVEVNQELMDRVYTKLLFAAGEHGGAARGLSPVPFVIPRSDGYFADVGFASHAWIPDTLKWLDANAPPRHLSRMVGLLLGYSAAAIAVHDEVNGGQFHRPEGSRFHRDTYAKT